jgi:hypothetical protein
MKVLYFDIEVIPNPNSLDDGSLNQLSWIFENTEERSFEIFNFLVEGTNIKHLSQNNSQIDSEVNILKLFWANYSKAEICVSHNFDFDYGFLKKFTKKHLELEFPSRIPSICTMLSGKEFKLKLGLDSKYPKLTELHALIENIELKSSHEALDDTLMLRKCFPILMQMGTLNFIHPIDLSFPKPLKKIKLLESLFENLYIWNLSKGIEQLYLNYEIKLSENTYQSISDFGLTLIEFQEIVTLLQNFIPILNKSSSYLKPIFNNEGKPLPLFSKYLAISCFANKKINKNWKEMDEVLIPLLDKYNQIGIDFDEIRQGVLDKYSSKIVNYNTFIEYISTSKKRINSSLGSKLTLSEKTDNFLKIIFIGEWFSMMDCMQGTALFLHNIYGSKSDCYIAHSIYKNTLDNNIYILRRFRDEKLLKSNAGKIIIYIYYKHNVQIFSLFNKFLNSKFIKKTLSFIIEKLIIKLLEKKN